jgi:hypothetical protein
MDKITFIIKGKSLEVYHYQRLLALVEAFPHRVIAVFFDVSKEERKPPKYLKFLNTIDRRFNSYKTNPFDIVAFAALKGFKITILKDRQEISISDWLVVPDTIHYNDPFFENLAKKGMLCVDAELDKVIHNRINNISTIQLPLAIKLKGQSGWTAITNMAMSLDMGVVNSIYKFIWYSQLSFLKFLRNPTAYSVIEKRDSSEAVSWVRFSKYYMGLILKIAKRKLDKKEFNWKIGLKKGDADYIFLDQPENSFWADPFIVIDKQEIYLFIEELNPETQLGEIACVYLADDFRILEKKTVLKGNTHFSFPNTFYYQDAYYMIPENSDSNNLDLYKASCFPYEWQFEKTLIKEVRFVDAVWIYHQGTYWLFANKINDFEHDNNDNLYLYYSNDLFGNQWQSHIQNPIISDAGKSRNAGNIFAKEGRLFRPSQNCSKTYGANVVINEILELTTHNYREITTTSLFVPKGYCGMHTTNSFDDVEVFDFLKREKGVNRIVK